MQTKQFSTPKMEKLTFSNLMVGTGVDAKTIASFPFAEKVGAPIPGVEGRVPGIAIFDIKLVPGTSIDELSALNVSARAFYNYVTQGYTSTNSSYEASDLMIYNLAVCYPFIFVQECKRALGAIRKYSTFNSYYGKMLVEALGFDYDDLSANIANFTAELNLRIARINESLAMLPNFKLLYMWNEIVSKIFTDATVEKHQLMAFVPTGYGIYNATSIDTGGAIDYLPRPALAFTTQTAMQYLDMMLDPLRTDSDINNLSGAILRVYSKSVQQLDFVAQDYVVSFSYSPAWLKAIHNMRLASANNHVHKADGTIDTTREVLVYQRSNILYSWPTVKVDATNGTYWDTLVARDIGMLTPAIVDFPYENPSPEEVLEATVFMPGTINTDLISGEINNVTIYTRCGYVYGCRVFHASNAVSGYTITPIHSVVLDTPTGYSSNVVLLSAFDWHPLQFIVTYDAEYPSVLRIHGDLCNYTVLAGNNLATVHDRCAYAMLTPEKNTGSVTK